MQFWELTIPVILKRDLSLKDMNEQLSKVINKTLLLDERLKEFHALNTFKLYVFSGLYPINKEGYKKGNMYSFKFRCMDRTFALKIKNLLKMVENDLIQVIAVELESNAHKPIQALYTLTPSVAVFTPENKKPRHWTKEDFSLDELRIRIHVNAKKKYELWTGEELEADVDFVERIEQINQKVIVLNYKKPGKLLTNKFRIQVKQDSLSQKLAFMVMGSGLLEKNSLGLGFCTYGRQRGE
ncbi:CRISPR-associated endoribonuclease Cas6 (plasmid) [Aneurinibacillus sp. Ricciae_BoGa-3]|uniref:CRISPR-associated endoribonuclease Cas6 n=1 Tax=Aneurinibacillus sp. Ricciae_BoGa-3 TaxID=3022697 RepID=UPI00234101DF|nr:CRISPR-associated endoribonuclease Cas6 [Aneurinibacillus sp. Ricciae_BoGa-3]WCK57156.1 CRISPR-associated endoribonuclease Cas6 [Aneurinibacillus sp. Ricciae_BoGa-3]